MNNINEKLIAGKALYAELLNDENAFFSLRDEMMVRGWKLGQILVEIKEEIGHGKWLFWLGGNWPEISERKARICIAFFKANEGWKPLKSAESGRFELGSVRKFQHGYIPAKERLQLENDEPDKPGAHHLTYVNAFSKWDRQFRNGSVEGFDLDEFRRENEPMLRRITEIAGTAWIYSVLEIP
jgi:hypothetical protein